MASSSGDRVMCIRLFRLEFLANGPECKYRIATNHPSTVFVAPEDDIRPRSTILRRNVQQKMLTTNSGAASLHSLKKLNKEAAAT